MPSDKDYQEAKQISAGILTGYERFFEIKQA